jgi:peptidoglycan/LPS O-acetylase OafA/YrhL
MTTDYRPFGALRLGLALLVLAQHGLLLLPEGPARAPFYDLELGAIAVAVFFALSGFIVAEATATFYANRPTAFLVNRCLRVVPPYLAALCLTAAADCLVYSHFQLVTLDAPLHGPPWALRVLLAGVLEIVPGLTAHRIAGQDFSFIPFAWTLRVEFAFYLAAFAMAWLLTRVQAPAARRWLTTGAFIAAYALFGLFLWHHDPISGGGRQALNIPFFAFGVSAYLLQRRPTQAARLRLLLSAACVPVAFVLCGERGHPVLAWQLPLLCALFAILLALGRAPSPRGAWRMWDQRLGTLSYPLYIGHGLVLTVLASIWPARGALPYGVAIVCSFGLAWLLHRCVEVPLAHLRNRVRGTKI